MIIRIEFEFNSIENNEIKEYKKACVNFEELFGLR